MTMLRALWASVEGNPKWMQSIHGWLTIIWFFASFPICIWAFVDPENRWLIPILIFVSFYAIVTGHWSSWQASRVEVKQVEQAEAKE